MDIAVVGAGRVGTSLAVLWRRAGHTIIGVSGRSSTAARASTHLPGVPVLTATEAVAGAEVTVLGVPDAAIAEVADELRPALRAPAWLVHLSGASRLDVLGDWAHRMSLHPLQTFPEVAVDRVEGCAAAVTADDEDGLALGERLARDAGAVPFHLRDEDHPLYHAAAVFASNHVVATSAIAERLFAEAGVPEPLVAMAPLQRATVDNVARWGPGQALTGPAVRGDVATITTNLDALARSMPEAIPVYVTMCRSMAGLAAASGRLSAEDHAAVLEAVAAWS